MRDESGPSLKDQSFVVSISDQSSLSYFPIERPSITNSRLKGVVGFVVSHFVNVVSKNF